MQPGTTAEWTRDIDGIRVRPAGADEQLAVWWYDGTITGGTIRHLAARLAYDDQAACRLIGLPYAFNAHTAGWRTGRLFRHHTIVQDSVAVHAIAIVAVDSAGSFEVRAEARWLVGLIDCDEDAAFGDADREMSTFLDSIGSRPRTAGAA
jgi:hypothetical protein